QLLVPGAHHAAHHRGHVRVLPAPRLDLTRRGRPSASPATPTYPVPHIEGIRGGRDRALVWRWQRVRSFGRRRFLRLVAGATAALAFPGPALGQTNAPPASDGTPGPSPSPTPVPAGELRLLTS